METITLTTLIFGSLTILAAGLTSGLTGFGYGLVSVPLLILILPPQTVVPIIVILSTIINITVAWEARKHISLRRIWTLLIGGMIGTPVGAYFLKSLDANVLKVWIGGVIVVFGVLFLKGFKKQVAHEKLALLPIGLVSGLLNGSTSMSGPPVILFFSNQSLDKQTFRASLVTYFTALNFFTIPVFLANGLFTLTTVKYSLIFLVPMFIGVTIGIKLSHRLPENLFRRIALIIVTLAGAFSIVSGLRLIG